MSTRTLYVAEPPQNYLQRQPVVVDCSVLAALVFEEPTRDQALKLVAGKQLVAPLLLDAEIVSVALKKLQLGTPADEVASAVQDYARHDIEMHGTEPRGQFEMARRYSLSAYDAAYLWLASMLRIPLLTFDKKLASAAGKHLSGRA